MPDTLNATVLYEPVSDSLFAALESGTTERRSSDSCYDLDDLSASLDAAFVAALTDVLGPLGVETDPRALAAYDWAGGERDSLECAPRLRVVARPANAREMADAVRLCQCHGVKYRAAETVGGPWNGALHTDSAVQFELALPTF